LDLGVNWFEGFELTKVDLSNNQIESIPDEIALQEVSLTCSNNVSVHLKFQPQLQPDQIFAEWAFFFEKFEAS